MSFMASSGNATEQYGQSSLSSAGNQFPSKFVPGSSVVPGINSTTSRLAPLISAVHSIVSTLRKRSSKF